MPQTRDDVFASIRRSLGVTGQERIRAATVDERLERAPKGVIPARGQREAEGRLALFKELAAAAAATLDVVNGADEVPARVADYLRRHNLPAVVRMGEDARLAAMPWSSTAIEVSRGRSDGSDRTAVSHAVAAVAETGTLALTSGPDNPTTLNFLPDDHIVVLEAATIAADLEGVWQKLRRDHGKGEMPRTVNFITGPSRSADIEQTILLGAHGPRRLHIVLVEGG